MAKLFKLALEETVEQPEQVENTEETVSSPELDAVQDAVSTGSDIQEATDVNDKAIEENPEGVTSDDVQEAQETLFYSLGRLGMTREMASRYSVDLESYNSNLDKLIAINNKLKLAKEHNDVAIDSVLRNLNISQEYTAVDWNRVLTLGVATIYRKITNKSTTSITAPGVLISLMLSAWSDCAEIIVQAAKDVARAAVIGDKANQAINTVDAIGDVVDAVRDRRSHAHDWNNAYIKGIPNMYKVLFQNYKKVKDEDVETYKTDLTDMKDIIGGIKKVFCRPCKTRRMSTEEIHDIKLFRPDKIAKEMQTAIEYHKEHNPKTFIVAKSFAQWWALNVVSYLSDNIHAE